MERLDTSDLHALYRLSEADKTGLSLDAFGGALAAVAEKFLPDGSTYSQKIGFYRSLHLKDLALARACSLGNAAAWEQFLRRYQNGLYSAALLISRDEQTARDLVDSIGGDLFVKLSSYSGRGSLEGWLKALLTNAYIDQRRFERRLVSLDENADILKTLFAGADEKRMDPRLSLAIERTFCRCTAEERVLLAAHFFDGRTLKEIAAALDIHESSVSRRLQRLLRALRRDIHRELRREGMSSSDVKDLLRAGEWHVLADVRGLLMP